ncbi:MAG TPA: hypothetical protein DCQ93_02810 [Bacteroidetes bacterium]|nr:hypothetical protein [Bacteroidota bacterium]
MMRIINSVVRPGKTFLIYWLMSLIVLSYFACTHHRGELELNWNQQHTVFADYFFSYITWLGSGWSFAIFVFAMLFVDRRKFFVSLASSLLVLITVTLFKQYFYPGEPRPLSFFNDSVLVHIPDGEEKLFYGSFPSGHTMSAFSMLFLASVFFSNRYMQLFLFMLAIITGLSRIYLMVHFIEDVLLGETLGVLLTILVLVIAEIYFPSEKINRPLIRIRKNE